MIRPLLLLLLVLPFLLLVRVCECVRI